MLVRVDTREHIGKNQHILDFFERNNIDFEFKKLEVGDYCNMENKGIIVDRKHNVEELVSNVCSKDHARFRREIERANELGIKLVILVETAWTRETIWDWSSKLTKVKGSTIGKALISMESKYGVKFVFCKKKDYPKTLYEIITQKVGDEENE